jgi:glycosyltransferase involved in cell wall biosynthesis
LTGTLKNGVSVIICCYNSRERIEKTLDFIFAQEVEGAIPWEIIIVDNASTDDTFLIAQRYLEKNKGRVGAKVVKERLTF